MRLVPKTTISEPGRASSWHPVITITTLLHPTVNHTWEGSPSYSRQMYRSATSTWNIPEPQAISVDSTLRRARYYVELEMILTEYLTIVDPCFNSINVRSSKRSLNWYLLLVVITYTYPCAHFKFYRSQ